MHQKQRKLLWVFNISSKFNIKFLSYYSKGKSYERIRKGFHTQLVWACIIILVYHKCIPSNIVTKSGFLGTRIAARKLVFYYRPVALYRHCLTETISICNGFRQASVYLLWCFIINRLLHPLSALQLFHICGAVLVTDMFCENR